MIDLSGLPVPFRRTFGAIDRLIALPIEKLGDRLEAKLKKNVEEHVEAVRANRSRRGEKAQLDENMSVKTAKALWQWAEGAAEIDLDDQELSAAWRAALDDILNERSESGEILNALKQLPQAAVKFFLAKFGLDRSSRMDIGIRAQDSINLSRLEGAGLIGRMYSTGMLVLAFLSVTVTFMFASAYMLAGFKFAWSVTQPLSALLILLAVGLACYLMSRTYVLTKQGRELVQRYREYIGKDQS